MKFDIKIMGERIRELKKEKKMSTKALAEAVGVDYSSMNAYERGTRTPPIDVTIDIASMLDCDVTYLIDSEQEHPRLNYLGASKELGLTYKAVQKLDDIDEYKAVLSWFIEHELMECLHGFLVIANAEEYPEAIAPLLGIKAVNDNGCKTVRKIARESWMHDLERLVDAFMDSMHKGERLKYTDKTGEGKIIPSYGETKHVITKREGGGSGLS